MTVPGELQSQRLDRALAVLMPHLTRSRIKRLITDGRVSIDDEAAAKASLKVRSGQRLAVWLPDESAGTAPRPQDINLEVLFEDDDLAVINKAAGLVVHPGAGQHDATLVDGLLHRFGDGLSHVGGNERPGIVHRLDKGTSGVIAVALSDEAHSALAAQFASRTVEKEYAAVVYGCPREHGGEIDLPIGRDRGDRTKVSGNTDRPRAAQSRWETIEDLGGFALIGVWPKTGRMHQVRAHLTSIHHPCVGDSKYVGAQWKSVADARLRKAIRDFPRPALHARRLHLDHPRSGERLEFTAPLPEDLEALLATLRSARDEA